MSETPESDAGCDCTELCGMGPTCPGGMLADLLGSGCWRTGPEHRLIGSVCSCLDWSAQCGNDIPEQWRQHVNASTRVTPPSKATP
jgi:hypothetical protein